MSELATPTPVGLDQLPGWAVTVAAEALGFDRRSTIHSAADWEAISQKAWDLLRGAERWQRA